MKKSLRFIGMFIALLMIVAYIPELHIIKDNISVNATNNDSSSLSSDDSNVVANNENKSEETEDEVFVPNFSFPDQLRAVKVTPGKDYFKDSAQSTEITQNEINSIIENISEIGLNSIVIDTDYNGKAYYTSSPDSTAEEQALKMLIDTAKKNYLYVYVNFDINFVLNEYESTELQDKIDYLTHIAHKFSRDYLIDGIILEGYYSSKNSDNYSYYMNNGSGIGFENWLLENGAYVFSLVSDSIHRTDNTIPVGINISNVWTNSSSNPDGSKTNDSFEALTDGYADTVNYLNQKYADFIYLQTTGSLTDPDIPFETIVKWWSEKAVACDIPLYVAHDNEKLGTTAAGWALEDQVIKQLMAIEKVPKYLGSSMSSYGALISKKSATNALKKFYENTLDVNALDNELQMNAPTKTTFTTYEPEVIFQGTFDKNFDVTFNGTPIELNEAGYFYIRKPLNVGLNTFQIANKGKVVTYKITRRIKVIQSINPQGQMSVNGGMTIDVSAIAYKGSTVTAKLNGVTIKLTETDGLWEGADPNSSYALFTGKFTAPKSGTSDVNIGNIVFNANYKGVNYETYTGANVTVTRLPEGVLPQTLIKFKNGNGAKIFYDTSTYDYPIPRTRLPANTYDYYLRTVNYNGKAYYITQSGRRVLASDADLIDGATFGENKVEFLSASVQNYDTIMQFKLDKNSPIEIASVPCNYYTGSRGNFYVNYNATSIVITFDYVVGNTNEVTLPGNSLFTSASWSRATDANGRPQMKLTLGLRKAGGYSGVAPSYTEDGVLTLRFNGHPSTLSGARIVIDPGHGKGAKSSGIWDPGATSHVTEQVINQSVSIILEQKLTAMGAIVYRMPTESQQIMTINRADVARSFNPDLMISIHCNSAGEIASATGTEAFYFQPFSQPLARYISNNVAVALGTNNRGSQYNEFQVNLQQEFPSSLVELGFVSNYGEAMKLANPAYQDSMANQIVAAIQQYLANN